MGPVVKWIKTMEDDTIRVELYALQSSKLIVLMSEERRNNKINTDIFSILLFLYRKSKASQTLRYGKRLGGMKWWYFQFAIPKMNARRYEMAWEYLSAYGARSDMRLDHQNNLSIETILKLEQSMRRVWELVGKAATNWRTIELSQMNFTSQEAIVLICVFEQVLDGCQRVTMTTMRVCVMFGYDGDSDDDDDDDASSVVMKLERMTFHCDWWATSVRPMESLIQK